MSLQSLTLLQWTVTSCLGEMIPGLSKELSKNIDMRCFLLCKSVKRGAMPRWHKSHILTVLQTTTESIDYIFNSLVCFCNFYYPYNYAAAVVYKS